MRDSLRPSSARVPRTSSFRKLTRSRAISTASRSLDAPRDTLASSRRRGSSQNALRTFPIRVGRVPDLVTRDRDERRPVFESRRLDVVGTDPRYFVRYGIGYRTYGHNKSLPFDQQGFAADRAYWTIVEVSRDVLAMAEAVSGAHPLRALDAIHVASAKLFGDRRPRRPSRSSAQTGIRPTWPKRWGSRRETSGPESQ
jgi:hypothetical protein